MSLLPLRRPVLSRTTYLILFACYIGIFLNLAFYRQVFPLLPVNSLHNWLVFLSMPIVAISVMNILTTLASFLKLDRLVISLFILLSASAQYFIWSFGVVIDRSDDHQYPRYHSGGKLCSALRRNGHRPWPFRGVGGSGRLVD
jgi:lipid A ethanolaminephosphotransferase